MKDTITMAVTCRGCEISAENYRVMDVTLNDVNIQSVLENFSIEDIVNHFGKTKIKKALNKKGKK